MGYMHNANATAETIDAEGWLHSGDVGRVDENDFLWITGRIKELIITAGGENIAPVPIEDIMKEEVKCISNCMAIGDRRKFMSMVITLRCNPNPDGTVSNALTGAALDFAAAAGSSATT